MSTARSLWASIQEDPMVMRKIHAWLTVLWLIAAIPILIWWRDSVPVLVFISVYANVAGHWSSYQASRVEVKQQEQMEQEEGER